MSLTRRFLVCVFLVACVLMMARPVMAQEFTPVFPSLPDELPGTATEGVDFVAVFLATLTGLLATAVVDAVKKFPFFTGEEKSKIGGAYANLVSIVTSVLCGYAVGYLAKAAGLLDESGLWQLVLYTWPMAKGWFEASGLRRAMAKSVADPPKE